MNGFWCDNVDISHSRTARSSGCDWTISISWNNEMKGWYVDSIKRNCKGSPLKAMRSRDDKMVCRTVRPATKKVFFKK